MTVRRRRGAKWHMALGLIGAPEKVGAGLCHITMTPPLCTFLPNNRKHKNIYMSDVHILAGMVKWDISEK